MFVAGCCVVGTAPPAAIPASSCLIPAAPVVGPVVLLDWRDLTRKKIEEPTKIAKRTLQVMLD